MANQKDLENALKYSELRKAGEYAEASKIDLSNADLEGADLFHANLSFANLSLADFSGADLRDADLEGAVISIGNVIRIIK